MKLVTKSIIFVSLAALVGTSILTYSLNMKEANLDNPSKVDISNTEDTYVMTNDHYRFEINKKNLRFEIVRGTQRWTSGEKDPLDPSLGEFFIYKYLNPVELYVLRNNSNSNEVNFSIYDEDICVTTIRMLNMDDYLSAHLSVKAGSNANPDVSVSFDINYYLMDDGLKISVTGINEEEANYTLSGLSLYPGFGMTYGQNNSKYLIPDGSGAIIDLSIPTRASSQLSISMYDKDIGISSSNRTIYSSDKLSIPMFANYSNEKTMIATIEDGDEYSNLNVKLAGMLDNYNVMYYRFIYKEIMTYEIPSMNPDKPIVNKYPQSERNDCNPTIHYQLYDEGMEYYDIAKKYQEYLISKGLLSSKYSSATMRLEFLMSENKKALFGKEIFKMTSAGFIIDEVEKLKNDCSNLSISLRGYTKGGYGGSYPYSFPIEDRTGGLHGYATLGNFLQENGINMNFVVDTVASFNSTYTANAQNVTQNLIASEDYINGSNQAIYRVNPNESKRLVSVYESYIDAANATGFDFSSIGNELFSTYHHESNTRTTSKEKYVEALKNFGHLRNVRKPNFYMFPYFESYLDTPTSSSGYLMENESVPFLQMVLSGYRSFYSSAINLHYLGDKQLVELIDYNVNPSYLLTEEDTMLLIDSPSSSYIYASKYSDWVENIKFTYSKVVNILNSVKGLGFIKREKIAPKVYKNTYEGGKVIVVNYSSETYDYSGHNIAPLSGEVFE